MKNRLMAGVAYRPVKVPAQRKVASQRNPVRSAARTRPPGRAARILKPGVPGDGTTDVVIPIPTVKGGLALFTPASRTSSTSSLTTTATTTFLRALQCTSLCALGYYHVCLVGRPELFRSLLCTWNDLVVYNRGKWQIFPAKYLPLG